MLCLGKPVKYRFQPNAFLTQVLVHILVVLSKKYASDEEVQLEAKVFNPLNYNGSRGLNTFENFGPIPNLRDADLT